MDKAQRIAELEAEIAELKDLDINSKKETSFENKIDNYLQRKLVEKVVELNKLKE